jgi:5-methylthioadenosine/S-adenosylhomocysteine deaminase
MRLNCGKIKEGMLADLLLIDLKSPSFTPNHNLISNIVYTANGSCVDTTICDGRILMEARKVEGEKEILRQAEDAASKLVERAHK